MLDKTFSPEDVERRVFDAWMEAGAFKAGAGARGGKAYTIVIPPPNVTGSLHMGHALNNTLQDIMVRFERMRGRDVLWQPGTDHAGIATQMVVERQMAARGEPARRDIGREAFLEKVWTWKGESGGTIVNQLKRLGASCDWSRERFTMDEGLSQAVLEVFVTLYEQGLIYKDKRLVNWDPKLETAISDLEVENTEVKGHMWHFKYPLAGGATYDYVEKDAEGNVTLRETRDYISIATTRPETMLGDGAVAVHPSDERYASIVGTLCEIPVGPKAHRRLIPIITDEYPDPTFGSGAVKITGAHDFNDYQVARRNAIPMYRLMDVKGCMRADGEAYALEAEKAAAILKAGGTPDMNAVDAINLVPDEYRGLDRFEARRLVVEAIAAEGLAVMTRADDRRLGSAAVKADSEDAANLVPLVEEKPIQQPFGDRSKVVIEPMLTDQWYVDAKTLAQPAIASVREGRTVFVPKNWEKTYFEWMENIEPWCISRQLWWGHQIPAWYGPDGEIFVAKTEDGAKAKARAHYGHDVALTRDEDVLDTWFSSALWPFSTLGWPEKTPELERYYPTNVLVTGFDIIFFWVARMMMMGLHFMGQEPFDTVYIHALVRDEKGQKMSKSKGNVIDPLEIVDEFGADALRFTLAAMAAQGRDIKLATNRVAGYRNFATKLWNASRFAEMNGCARRPGFAAADATTTLNRWIITETGRAVREVTEAIESYRFNDAAGAAYRFVWNTFCDWYLELAKPVMTGEDGDQKEETRATTAYVLDQIFLLLHPFMPFVTEELFEKTGGTGSLLALTPWPELDFSDEDAASEINWLIALISDVRAVRSEMNVAPSSFVSATFATQDEGDRARWQRHEAAINRLARLENLSLSETTLPGSVQVPSGSGSVCLVLAGVIDLEAEKDRLKKEVAKLDGEIKRINGKLSNEKFVANAPEEIVEGEREKRAGYEERKAKVETAFQQLSGA